MMPAAPETVNFNIFLDQSQLATGLSEFGLYAGVLAPQGFQGPVYSNSPAISGFYRRGISDRLTVGANLQADRHGWMTGAETVIASGFGSFGGFVSASKLDGVGKGWASILTFQRTIARSGTGADALSFSIEARSRNLRRSARERRSTRTLYCRRQLQCHDQRCHLRWCRCALFARPRRRTGREQCAWHDRLADPPA